MSIYSIEQSKKLRAEGKRLGRAGLSARAHELVMAYAKENPDGDWFKVINLAGRLRAISLAARVDTYWREKTDAGFYDESEYDLKRAKIPEEGGK